MGIDMDGVKLAGILIAWACLVFLVTWWALRRDASRSRPDEDENAGEWHGARLRRDYDKDAPQVGPTVRMRVPRRYQCGARHEMTGVSCELLAGHTVNHRGESGRISVQWPREETWAPVHRTGGGDECGQARRDR